MLAADLVSSKSLCLVDGRPLVPPEADRIVVVGLGVGGGTVAMAETSWWDRDRFNNLAGDGHFESVVALAMSGS